jgi:hypothetical protein
MWFDGNLSFLLLYLCGPQSRCEQACTSLHDKYLCGTHTASKGGEEREFRSHMTTDCPIGESVQVLMKYYILLYPLACFLGEGEGAEMLADLTREMALGLIGPTP